MKMKFKSFLLTKNHVTAMIEAMRKAGLHLEIDWQAGTVEAFHGKTSIFQALEKGENQPWIVRHVTDLFA